MGYQVIYDTGLNEELLKEFHYYLHQTKKALAVFKQTDGEGNEDLGPIHEYGLHIEAGALQDVNPAIAEEIPSLAHCQAVYWQLSTGGPGDDITVVWDHRGNRRIFYRFLPWFHGIAVEVTGDPDFNYAADWLEEFKN